MGQPRVIASGDHVARVRAISQTKGEEDVHDILQGMQDSHRGWPAVRLTAGVKTQYSAATPAGNASGGLASVGDGKIKDKEKGKAEHRECI